MPTPAERRALLFVATVAALGLGVRGCRAVARPEPPTTDKESLARQIALVDSAVASGGRRRPQKNVGAKARPSDGASLGASPGSRAGGNFGAAAGPSPRPPGNAGATAALLLVDVDRADVAELDRLPGIGPALAARIVADRESNGVYGSLQELQRVKGIGPALAAKLTPHVTFSAKTPPRPRRAAASPRGGAHP